MQQIHLDEEQIQRALHRELGRVQPVIEQHLNACEECRSKLIEARMEEQWTLDRLGSLDHSLPELRASSIVSRESRPRLQWMRLVAGVALAVGMAGVAYAVPGSSFRAALEQIVHLLSPHHERPLPASAPASRSQAGVALAPGPRLTIDFADGHPGDTVLVSLTDGTEVVARSVDVAATFSSDADQLLIQHAGGAAHFEILIPRAAPWIGISVGGRRFWLKTQGRIQTRESPDLRGRYVLPLSQKPSSPAP